MPFNTPHPECGQIVDRKASLAGTFQLLQIRYETCVVELLLVFEHGSWQTIRYRRGQFFVWSLT